MRVESLFIGGLLSSDGFLAETDCDQVVESVDGRLWLLIVLDVSVDFATSGTPIGPVS